MKPTFVLGIDGLPYTLTMRLIEEGLLPNLAQLVGDGCLRQMNTTVPDFSCVAWTSFATGVNPGKHGIYGFQDFHPKTGEQYLPNVMHCKAKHLWHLVGNEGGRTIVFNLPGTYPALPLKGKMVSGFVAPEFNKACYPPSFAKTLKELGYRMDLDGRGGLGSPQHVEKAIKPVFEARKKAIRHLINNESWDLCIAVITETDRLQHFFLHTLDDKNDSMHEWTKSFYIQLDEFIGEVAHLLSGKADLFMVSDHGFGVVKKEIILQDLLTDLGLASPCVQKSWQDSECAATTKVFALDPGRFYINRKNSRFKSGFVKPDEEAQIIETISSALMNLTDDETGEKIVSEVRAKCDGFVGDAVEYAPDLVAATNPGYYFKAYRYPSDANVTEMKWEANHVWNDAIVYTPYKIDGNDKPVIWDVLPSAIANMGLAIPDEIDGRNLNRPER